jgi:hypothetical protein
VPSIVLQAENQAVGSYAVQYLSAPEAMFRGHFLLNLLLHLLFAGI